ncbi:MAG: bifunctional diaminohydroxyphosphoribosylaminopyrimidine deaminase/5-amino-6-(5-phosphoribosylamino)uracil reductase RibD [Myxococcota bacterium]|nr:bifunctional diaminohydroxyphosphoribosylaminopyrimidine deaminase/5-amino-6-(5-phosphoribosylamino)uracil reductase RibD [Myxococcota bacterium]
MSNDRRYMERALALARHGTGWTTPNPLVGCVLVRDGAILAEGWHRRLGDLHAERAALQAVDFRAEGATAYVTLEPCCHHGRQPPCTEALLEAGVSRVVVAMVDPDERVSGRGIAQLRAAGVEVEVGLAEAEARRLNAAFVSARERGRPLVVLKAGVTLDGRIASADGESKWITGPAARARGHALRHALDAILVGANTLREDDPGLDTRLPDGRGSNAVPVVLDSGLSIRGDAKVLRAGARPVVFCATHAPERDLPADVIRVPHGPDGLDLGAVLAALQARGIQSVLVEGGARVHRSFLDAGLVDRIHLFVAPRVLVSGPGWVAGAGFPLANAPAFRLIETRIVGDDAELVMEA